MGVRPSRGTQRRSRGTGAQFPMLACPARPRDRQEALARGPRQPPKPFPSSRLPVKISSLERALGVDAPQRCSYESPHFLGANVTEDAHQPQNTPPATPNVRGGELEPAVSALAELYRRALERVLGHVVEKGRISARLLERHQLSGHALAYLATELEAARQLLAWVERLEAAGLASDLERRIAGCYVGQLCRELVGGVDLGACENVALEEMWLGLDDLKETVLDPRVRAISDRYASGDSVCELVGIARQASHFGNWGLDDSTLEDVRAEFARFADERGRSRSRRTSTARTS